VPGGFNYFELDRVFYKKLSAPYINCLNDVNSLQSNKIILNFLHSYTEQIALNGNIGLNSKSKIDSDDKRTILQ